MLDVGVLVSSYNIYQGGTSIINKVSCHFCNDRSGVGPKEESFCVLMGVYRIQ